MIWVYYEKRGDKKSKVCYNKIWIAFSLKKNQLLKKACEEKHLINKSKKNQSR